MLEEIITNFDVDKIRTFFLKNGQFVRKYEEISNHDCCHFSNGTKIGEIEFADKNQYFAAYAFKVDNDLTEYSGKKAQYDLAKKVLKIHQKDAGIFIFYDERGSFRFSLVFPIYSGARRIWNTFKRYTYFVSRDQTNKTFLSQIGACAFDSLEDIKEAFSVEKVTKDFFSKYVLLFNKLVKDLDSIQVFRMQAEMHAIKTEDFAKKLLGQIVFLYFLQKKGWLGVPKEKNWGCGDRKFLRNIFEKCKQESGNFYNDYLEYLFYDTLNNPRVSQKDPDYSERFECKIPYLNGGLFEPEYDWKQTDMRVENPIFSEILDTFDQFNFTIDENTPSDVEVSVDPEMLGKIFENLLPENIRKGKGAFYTPREIVQYMCKESLISCLNTKLLGATKETVIRDLVNFHLHLDDDDLDKIDSLDDASEASENVSLLNKYSAKKIDDALSEITIVDPACGSGAFLVGILNEIIGIRQLLYNYYLGGKKSIYDLKKETILNCIYGVDIDPGAVDIAKLRLWLALVVDAKRPTPLPNLDFKIMQGNSLLEEYNGIKFYEEDSKNKLHLPDLKLDKTRKKLLLAKSILFNADTEDKKKEARKEIVELTNVLVKDILEKQKTQGKKKLLIDLRGDGTTATKSKKYIESTLENIEIDSLINNLANPKYPKPFFLWKLNFCEVFDKGGFDIVIGNPPYVNVEKIDKSIKDNIKLFKTAYQKYDLYVLFYEKGLRLLRDKGILSYITSNKFLSQGYGMLLRQELLKHTIQYLINFNFDIFDSAVVRTCIVQVMNNNANDNIIKILDVKYKSDSKKFDNKEYNTIDQSIFQSTAENNFRINLTDKKIGLLKKIEHNTLRVDDICSVNYGLRPVSLSGKDKLFFIKDTYQDGLKKYFEGKDTGRWIINRSSYLDYNIKDIYNPMFSELFENEKLVGLCTLSEINKLRFIYDNEGYYCNHSVGILTLWYLFEKENNLTIRRSITIEKIELSKKYNYKYIQAILNSPIIKFYVNELLYDGTHFYPNHMKQLPIKKIAESGQRVFIDLVDQILNIKKQNKDADTKNLESQIDQLVYKLYDLTPEEIAIVENSSTK